jgi:hypothetical protein
MEFLDLLLGSL